MMQTRECSLSDLSPQMMAEIFKYTSRDEEVIFCYWSQDSGEHATVSSLVRSIEPYDSVLVVTQSQFIVATNGVNVSSKPMRFRDITDVREESRDGQYEVTVQGLGQSIDFCFDESLKANQFSDFLRHRAPTSVELQSRQDSLDRFASQEARYWRGRRMLAALCGAMALGFFAIAVFANNIVFSCTIILFVWAIVLLTVPPESVSSEPRPISPQFQESQRRIKELEDYKRQLQGMSVMYKRRQGKR